ncbi:glutamine-hydrolyzing NAD+ synthase [Aureococcus anophagefferens]|uniref:Glutamine-hydrolyzing NAD+ synthase n=1 Tax=Aureococcus anophagefferens TaxID=44056 RepID=A0ABR1FU91_AURAN
MQSAWGDERSFFDLHAHDFVRVSTCVPRVFLGDPLRNAAAIGELYDRAVADGSSCCVFPSCAPRRRPRASSRADRSRDMTWSQNGRDFRDLVEKALDKLGLPRSNCLAYTMPGFATTAATKSYALELMRCLGVTAETLDITPSCEVMLGDLGHAYAAGERGRAVYDVTFENVQAGERTNHLFRLANHKGAFVVGTGDLSELALGWCTYGVGDHMSHYCVNASVPKSLIQCVIQWVISSDFVGADANAVLTSILAVEISPELVPQEDGEAMQSTEDALGPYDLHDFQLYCATRRGFAPAKAAYLAMHAWASDCPDTWERAHFEREPPPTLAGAAAVLEDRAFPLAKVLDFQRTFLRRFFLTSQFKRTCVPNAPKTGG